MKTLKDFYIVVTKQNQGQITNLLCPSFEFKIGKFIHFDFDDVDSWCINQYTKNKQRISLSKLKRYIDNTPTREGLKKAQNASKIYKYKYEQEKKLNDIHLEEINKWKGLYYESSTNLDFANDKINDLRKEREAIVSIAKQDINLGKKTLTEWVNEIVEYDKYLIKECTSLSIENVNLNIQNTKLSIEIRKHKIVAMVSLIITLLALGLWI